MSRSRRLARPDGETRMESGEVWSRDMVRYLDEGELSTADLAEIRAWVAESRAERERVLR